MKGRAPGKVRRQRRLLQALLASKQKNVGAGERSETIEAVVALDGQKYHVDRRRDFAIREKTLPQSLCARALEPHHGQQEHTCRDQIEAGSQAREQVEA